MTTIRDVDRLVVANDAIAARVWPQLGTRVRDAYTADRGGWVALRQKTAGAEPIPQATLTVQQAVFAGWARAFRAAAAGRPKAASGKAIRPVIPATSASAVLPLVATKPAAGGAGAAVAGAVVLAGLIAVAARRRTS